MAKLPTHQFSAEKMDILLVDDRPDNLLALEATLSDPEYRLIKATSGDEALRYLLDNDPALILMDVQMPELDGFETAQIIKKSERSRHIPIIFITAINKEERFVHTGYQSGAVDYISKPFDPEILKSKVAIFADLHRKTRQLLRQERYLREAELRENERRLAQLEIQALRREQAEQQRYVNLVESIEHGIVWSMDPLTLQVTFVSNSAESLLGFPADQWKLEPGFFLKQVLPEDLEKFRLALREQEQNEKGSRVEHRFVRKDGSIAWLQTWLRSFNRGESSGEEIRCLSVDITVLKRTEADLRRAIETRDEFFSIASHELKTPVTPIKLQLQLIQRSLKNHGVEALSEDRMQKSLETCEKQINRLSRLVDELLDVSRIRTGKLTLDITQFDLCELLMESVERFQMEAREKGLGFEYVSCADTLVTLDRFRVEQVVVNLISNAIKYSTSGTILVQLQSDENSVSLHVRDEGIGIAKEDQHRIFDRFERAVPSANYAGLGLGLYIVTEILRAQNGTIQVNSTPGKGSTFTVTLPRVYVAQEAAESTGLRGSSSAATTKETVV